MKRPKKGPGRGFDSHHLHHIHSCLVASKGNRKSAQTTVPFESERMYMMGMTWFRQGQE